MYNGLYARVNIPISLYFVVYHQNDQSIFQKANLE